MADLADVETALAGLITAALYPIGTASASAVGVPCLVYRGWPVSAALDADLAAGRVNVSVFSLPGSGRNTTRWGIEDTVVGGTPTLTVSVVGGNSAVFGGSAAAGQVAGLLVDQTTYVYRTQDADTPAQVAAALAQAARPDRSVWLSGAVVTLPESGSVIARVVVDGQVLQEVRRQEQLLRITLWCPTPALRDAAAAAVDVALAAQAFMTFADGSVGRMRYAGSTVIDQQENARLYRRELMYMVEYPTTSTQSAPAMLFGSLALTGTVVEATSGTAVVEMT